MRITPLDVRKQEFRRVVRGLDPDEVYAFLATVADEYEAVLSDNKQLRGKLLELDEKVSEYRNMERTLRDTLLTAERVMSEARENARKEGTLILEDARLKAERETASIAARVANLQNQIRELRAQRDGFLVRMKTLAESQIAMVDNYRADDGDDVGHEISAPHPAASRSYLDPPEDLDAVPDAPLTMNLPLDDDVHDEPPAHASRPVAPLPSPDPPASPRPRVGDQWRDYFLNEERAASLAHADVPPAAPEPPVVTGVDQASPWDDAPPAVTPLEDLADVVAEVSAEAEARASGAIPVLRDRRRPGGQSGPTVATYPVPTADAGDSPAESGSHPPHAMSAPPPDESEDQPAGSASGWSLSRFTRGLGQL